MLLIAGIGALVTAVLAITWGISTEFRQSSTTGPLALVPTYPFAVQAAMLSTLGLFMIRRTVGWLPWWEYIGLGALVGGLGIVLIKAVRSRRARRPARAAQRSGM